MEIIVPQPLAPGTDTPVAQTPAVDAPAQAVPTHDFMTAPASMRESMAAALVNSGTMTHEAALAELAAGDPDADFTAPEAALNTAATAAKDSMEVAGALQSLPDSPLPPSTAKFYGKALETALRNPPSEQQKQIQYTESMAFMDSTYGPEKAGQMIEAARAEVQFLKQSIPGLEQLLDRSGGASDPYLVARLADRNAARLKAQTLAAHAARMQR